MTALFVTVLVASLVGSPHCAGMCGAFVALAAAPGRGTAAARLGRQAAYHAGRLVTYSLLGAAAGTAGAAFDLGGAVFGMQRAALAAAGVGLVVFGVATLARLAGARLPWLEPPARLGALYGRVATRLGGLGPGRRALAVGLLSTLLPCGWLYAFALTAAGTGNAALGAATMAAFWIGTLPVLAAVGAGVAVLAGPLRRHAPAVAALVLVLVGLAAVAGRLRVPAPDAHGTAPGQATCCAPPR